MSARWTVVVDPELCRCNAVCASVAPDVFVVGDEVAELLVPVLDDAQAEAAADAASLCPTDAIVVQRLEAA